MKNNKFWLDAWIGFLSAGSGNGFVGANFVLGMAQCQSGLHNWKMAYFPCGLSSSHPRSNYQYLGKKSFGETLPNDDNFQYCVFCCDHYVILARDKQKNTASFVFKDFQNFTGFGIACASLLGLLHTAFGMTGYGKLPLRASNGNWTLTPWQMPRHIWWKKGKMLERTH